MTEPSEKEMLEFIDIIENGLPPSCRYKLRAIRRLIEEHGEWEKKISEWKGRAKEIMDEGDTDDSSDALLEDIRDFGKEGK